MEDDMLQAFLNFYAWALPEGNAAQASLLDAVTTCDQAALSGGRVAPNLVIQLEPALGIEPRTC